MSLATDGAGALTSTAAQVVAALNANPAASAILWAATYRGNAGAGIVQPSAVVHLSDFLWAPRPGDAGVDPGYQVPRVPYQQYILRICKVCDGSKTGFFVYAQEHAREWVGPLVALETANRLLKNYGTDPETTSYVDNLDIFIDPSINTDGGNYSMLQGGASGQRRTMTRFCGPNNPAAPLGDVASTSFDPASRGSWGIDDNRGFSVGSLFDGYEGASSSCTSDTYAGPSELSQPEDKNEVALETTYPNIRFSMNIHTSGGYFMWSPASYKTVEPRGAAVPVEGLAGGVLGGGPQDGHRDRDLPRHGRHPGPHRLGGRRAVLGRGQQLRRGLVQQEHHRLRLRVRRAPVLADLDLEQRRRPGLHADLRDRGSRRGPGVRRRHVRPDELGARVPERHHGAGRDDAVGAVGHDLADADLARVQRVGAVGHLLHDGRLDPDDGLDPVPVLGLPGAGGRDPHLHAEHDAEVLRRRPEGQHVGGADGDVRRRRSGADDDGERVGRRLVEPLDRADRAGRQLGRGQHVLHPGRRPAADVQRSVHGAADGSHTLAFWSVDNAGNVEAAHTRHVHGGHDGADDRRSRPRQTVAIYRQGASIAADYSCDDNLVRRGQLRRRRHRPASPFDTSSLGWHTFTVTAADRPETTTVVTHSYYVTPTDSSKPQAWGKVKVAPGRDAARRLRLHAPGQAPGDGRDVRRRRRSRSTPRACPGAAAARSSSRSRTAPTRSLRRAAAWSRAVTQRASAGVDGRVPDLCGGGEILLGEGTFSAGILASDEREAALPLAPQRRTATTAAGAARTA